MNETTWDSSYATTGYEKQPDEELVQLCRTVAPGTALDIGAGEGRHSLWLASGGWDVRAVDISSVGIANLRRAARALGLSVRTFVQSISEYDFGDLTYDLVLSTGSALNFFRKQDTKVLIEKLKSATRPGGHLYLTLSTVDDPAYKRHLARATNVEDNSFWSSETRAWIAAFRPGELRDCMANFEVLSYSERTVHDTHGGPHQHVMAFALARKPGGPAS